MEERALASSYVLEQRVIGPHKVLDIDEQRYFSLQKARTVLADALAFEQGYELMLGNFIEMEMAFTEISLRASLETDHQHPTLAGTLRDANRQVINVLTAIRGYVDQAPQLFRALDLTPKFAAAVKTELNDMHAASLDARAAIDAAIKDYLSVGADSAIGLAARLVGDKEADVPLLACPSA